MIILPAIDLYQGQCVRLKQGKFDDITIYSKNPLEVAKTYQEQGAEWLHVIDLNGAETGNNSNKDIIKQLVENTNLRIQVGGGIRTKQQVIDLLTLGVDRVILGSYAVENLKEVKELVEEYQDRIIVSVDSKNGLVTYNGWQNKSNIDTIEFCKELEDINIKTIVYTDIEKDGMMEGPNIEHYRILQEQTSLQIIASGGVSSYRDIVTLNKMNLYGAIVGKALYVNEMTVKEMIACLQDE